MLTGRLQRSRSERLSEGVWRPVTATAVIVLVDRPEGLRLPLCRYCASKPPGRLADACAMRANDRAWDLRRCIDIDAAAVGLFRRPFPFSADPA